MADAEANAEPEQSGFRRSIRALKHRNYRLLWTGNVISQTGDWMDQVAFSWLVYDMTGSTVYLALVNVCRALPILAFTLMAGVIADRVNRKTMLVVSQAVMMVVAIVLSTLMTFDALTLGMVFVIATVRGIVNSFNQPARQALISELVPRDDLPSAVALNSTTFNLSKVFGPALSGVLIASVGINEAFYLNTLSIMVAMWTLLLMSVPPQEAPTGPSKSMLGDLREGLAYLQREKAMRTLVILALVPMVLGQPYQTMLTVFAKDVFHAGSAGLGLLQSTAAVGAMVGIFFVASNRDARRFNLQMIIGLAVFGLALTLFSVAPSAMAAVPFLLLTGFSQQIYQTSNNTLIQMNVAAEYRGRVLSTLFLQRGMIPLGTIFAGVATTAVGPRVAVGGMAVALLAIAVLSAPMVLASLKTLGQRREQEEALAPALVRR